MKKKSIVIISLIIILSFTFYYVFEVNYDTRGYIGALLNKVEGKTLNNKFEVKIKSGDLCTDYNIDTALKDIDKLGLNTIDIPVVINIASLTASDMSIDNYSKEQAIKLIEKLNGKKINIILDPYPWIENGSKFETEWHPNNINYFFYNWKTKVLKPLIDEVAVPYHVDALNIGTSFTKIEPEEDRFCDMVDYVRSYYKGLITYRTSWWKTAAWDDSFTREYEKKLNNKLFSKVDFISIAAYFELTENSTNIVGNLVNALQSTEIYNRKQNVKQEIKNFYSKWNKPIFFGELGFPPIEKASMEPWNPFLQEKANGKEQANCFEAYKSVFENEQWNLGFSIFAIGNEGPSNHYYPSDFSVNVIKGWYSK